MELLMLIVGIVLLWKFSSVINLGAITLRNTAQVKSEKIIQEAVLERSEQFEDFKNKSKDVTLYTHSEIMSHLKVDD